MAKEVKSGQVLCCYEAERELTPASVMKTVTTASALEILGEDFRFETSIQYDGQIRDSVLNGNLYIYGGGDPTLNSSVMKMAKDGVIAVWASAVKKAGIRQITGSIIADESIFDTEGVSMKWLMEDLGADYGQGSYGLNIFDNHFALFLKTDFAGSQPGILYTEPPMPSLVFHNYLKTVSVTEDSYYITGFPYSNERYLYGALPSNRPLLKISGDIPEPALYLAGYFHKYLSNQGVKIKNDPSCYRILAQAGQWKESERTKLVTTHSPALKEIVHTTNFVSHNLFADALVKTLGLRCPATPEDAVSSFDKGARVIRDYWNEKGINASSLWMFDGSGLALTDKVTVEFLCNLYVYMATQSKVSDAFIESLPQAGMDGTLAGTLRGTPLQGKARLKSGSMSRVRCYGGYVTKSDKQYAVAIIINNYSGKSSYIRPAIEELFLALFKD
jgi:D-alanyl-D-alanine carboxypeptidase/D-alanyl-D-alanine-endopeptidase (penicillin-binding protein 4)